MVTWRSNKLFKEVKEDDIESRLGHWFGERKGSTKADTKSYDIYVYTSPERTPFVGRLFRQILTKHLLLHLFSSVIYSRILMSLFNSTFQQAISYITLVLFHGFRQYCKHNFFSYDDSRLCCLLLYIFTILHFSLIFCLKN